MLPIMFVHMPAIRLELVMAMKLYLKVSGIVFGIMILIIIIEKFIAK